MNVFTAHAVDSSQVVLNLKSASYQIGQAEEVYKAGQINEAKALVARLQPALVELTELHSQLFKALKDETAATLTAEQEKKLTIEFAKLRDRTNFLAGQVSMKQGNNMEAVKHFVQVVQSQRSTELGEKAYSALRDLGFSPKLSIADQI